MALNVNVYRSNALGDCTNGGLSGRHDRICVVNVDGPADPIKSKHPTFALIDGYRRKILVPVVLDEARHIGETEAIEAAWQELKPAGKLGPMMGGNYAEVGSHGAVPIHDRFETQAEYDALSR